jgi:phosphoribosylaminoimidazole-succinocarboxamide synthase
MPRGELIYRGAAKDVFSLGSGRLEIVFADNLAVWGKRFDVELPQKGALMCEAAARALQLAERAGVATHLLERSGETSLVVKAGYPSSKAAANGGPIAAAPFECVSRHRVAGSLLTRLVHGQKFGEVEEARKGAKLKWPMVEFCARNTAGAYLGGSSWQNIRFVSPASVALAVLAIDARLAAKLEQGGLVHVDGKKEFAFDAEGRLMIVDCFGTVEEDRIWRIQGEELVEDLSLDRLRTLVAESGEHLSGATLSQVGEEVLISCRVLAECFGRPD